MAELAKIRQDAGESIKKAYQLVEENHAVLKQDTERIREHYEAEAQKSREDVLAELVKARQELAALGKYRDVFESEAEAQNVVTQALEEAKALRQEAASLLEQARQVSSEERKTATQKAREVYEKAEAVLNQATRDAGRIVNDANQRAEQIAGDAYNALRDKQLLEQAAKAIRNIVDGYGDKYIVPTRSLLDDLAEDFGHTEAGQALRSAREHSQRMVVQGEAATCEYAEANRRETAIRFVIDAFNGRVDAILSRTRHDNIGTLEQEIRDAFSLVNLNGQAFRNAQVHFAYLESRLAELKWAVVAQELKLKEREEQRRIQEQMREEEKARREYEKAMQDAAKEEEAIKKALEKARMEAEHANAQEKAKFEAQLAELTMRLTEAEAKNQRAVSLAQQTRTGHVYIISNIGSFGESVFKIGMTRRLEPMDRVKELSDASVPFEFDVHAIIYSEDAPTLERLLHEEFDDLRINKVNYRKEFFRLPLERVREFVSAKGLNVAFTMAAQAHEYRETLSLEKMTPEEREKYQASWRFRSE